MCDADGVQSIVREVQVISKRKVIRMILYKCTGDYPIWLYSNDNEDDDNDDDDDCDNDGD